MYGVLVLFLGKPCKNYLIRGAAFSMLEDKFGHFFELERKFVSKLDKEGLSRNTVKNYKTDLDCFNKFLRASQAPFDLNNLTTDLAQKYNDFLNQKLNSDNSKRRRIQTLRIFLDFLVGQSIILTNPVRNLQSSPKFLDIPRPTPFSDIKTLWTYLLEEKESSDEMIKLLAQRNQIILLLIFGAGLKVSDLSHLKEKQIFIDASPRVMLTPFKREPYTIPLPPIFASIFLEYGESLCNFKKKSGLTFDELLFNANPYQIISGGLSPRGLELIFEEFRKKLVLQLTPKSLRQACIFKWLAQNKKDNIIKEWMGVSSAYSLKLYKDHATNNLYSDQFLEEMYLNLKRRRSPTISTNLL